MIKLFWNTHNQNKPTSQKKDDEYRNYIWGQYHKDNSDKWIYKFLDKIKFKTIDSETDLNSEDILIIVDSSIEKKKEFYTKLKLMCNKIFLIHLGDEAGLFDLSNIYNKFNYTWRTFCSNRYFNNDNVSCLPLGYKSGTVFTDNLGDRKYKWSFIGTPHKSSRHDLLFQLSKVKPHFTFQTKRFNDKKKIMEVDELSEVLSSTCFIPCPNGFVHPETYRLYEALECHCIPIIENSYKYYDRLFPDNPFLKIDKWMEAKEIVLNWTDKQIMEKRENCKTWWVKYKSKLQNDILTKLGQ